MQGWEQDPWAPTSCPHQHAVPHAGRGVGSSVATRTPLRSRSLQQRATMPPGPSAQLPVPVSTWHEPARLREHLEPWKSPVAQAQHRQASKQLQGHHWARSPGHRADCRRAGLAPSQVDFILQSSCAKVWAALVQGVLEGTPRVAAGVAGLACSPRHGAAVLPGRGNFEPCTLSWATELSSSWASRMGQASCGFPPGPQPGSCVHPVQRAAVVLALPVVLSGGWGLCLRLRVCCKWMPVAQWPHWAAHRHGQPLLGTVSALFLLFAELQGGAGADRPAKSRQYGECLPRHLAVQPQLTLCSSAGTSVGQWEALTLHLTPSTHFLTLVAPCTPLPMVLAEEGVPVLCTALSPSSAHPPQVSPCHCLLPSASRCHGFLFCLPQCFMNSILQCLSNTKELRDYCLQNQYLRDLNNNSRMRTALMSGNCQSLGPGSAPCGASLQRIPGARPCSPRPPHALGDPHPEVSASSQPYWGRHCAVGAQPVGGLGHLSKGYGAHHGEPGVGC